MGTRKLDFGRAQEIRALYAGGGETLRSLATQFGVSRQMVLEIVHGRAWLSDRRRRRGEDAPNARLTEAQVRSIRRLASQGVTTRQDLARQYEVTTGTIDAIVARRSWAHVEPGGLEEEGGAPRWRPRGKRTRRPGPEPVDDRSTGRLASPMDWLWQRQERPRFDSGNLRRWFRKTPPREPAPPPREA